MEASIKYTLSHAQQRALNPRKSCWVEASAGSGKTKVLTDRILRLLLARVPVEHILCLTFTNAGAIEMSSRLQNRLYQWTQMDEADIGDELKALGLASVTQGDIDLARALFSTLLDKPFGIRIQTLHAFCQFLLRTFPLEVGLVPHFDILDDLQSFELKKQAFAQAMNVCTPETLRQLAVHGTLSSIQHLCQELLAKKTEFHSLKKESAFLKEKHEILSTFLEVDDLSIPENLVTDFIKNLPDFLSFEIAFERGTEQDKTFYQHLMRFITAPLEEKIKTLPSYRRLFLTLKNEPRKKLLSTQLKNALDLHQVLERETQRLIDFEIAQNHQVIFHASMALSNIGYHYIQEYERLKRERGMVDYDDLITLALKLLENAHNKPWILFKLEYDIHHILIDEAQDTSREQWDLISALVSEFFPGDRTQNEGKTLFVVGDIKQSIYSFQGADPKSFKAVKKLFSALPDWDFIDLTMSYRSAPPVLTFVDRVFQNLQTSSSFLSDTYCEHESFRKTAPGCVEVWPLIAQVEKETPLEKESWSLPGEQQRPLISRLSLAHQVADVIEGWLKNHVVLAGRGRPIEPRDIMILVRRREAFMDELIRTLKKRNVPVTGVDRLALLDQIGAQDLLALADVLLFPQDDLAVATLLKSPLFGLSETDLFILAHNRGPQTLWDRLPLLPQGALYSQRLEVYRQLAARHPSPYDFFAHVLAQENGWQSFMARLGPEVHDTLEEFLNLCLFYQKNNAPNLQAFVSWVRQQPVEIKRAFDPSKENNVRILTVHGAKGLESPIVILPDTTQVPRERSSLYWIGPSGAVLWVPDRSYQTSTIKGLKEPQGAQEEYYRLLYVALTRAEDQLYICGWGNRMQNPYPSWYDTCQKSILSIENHEKRDGILYMGQPMEEKSSAEAVPIDITAFSEPQWVYQNVPSINKIPSSSKFQSTQQQKGIFVHKILEHLIRSPLGMSQAESIIEAYLDPADNASVKQAVLSVINHKKFSLYFNNNTLTEVPISGMIKGQRYQGIIDVLTINKDQKTIHILDYKTGRPHRSPAYINQLTLYKKLVQSIYPHHHIETALLWTESGEIDSLS